MGNLKDTGKIDIIVLIIDIVLAILSCLFLKNSFISTIIYLILIVLGVVLNFLSLFIIDQDTESNLLGLGIRVKTKMVYLISGILHLLLGGFNFISESSRIK